MSARTIISLTAQTLVESGCLSVLPSLFGQDPSLDGSTNPGQPSQHRADSSDGIGLDSQLHVLNAAKFSLLITKIFSRCYYESENNIDLTSLRLDDFIVKLQYSPSAEEEGCQGQSSWAGEDQLLFISAAEKFKAIITSTNPDRWILLDIYVKHSDAQKVTVPCENYLDVATLMQSLGKLLYSIIYKNDAAPASESKGSNGEGDTRIKSSTLHISKARRSAANILFDQFIELGHPTSICRLLSDLIDGGETRESIESFDGVIHDLEQMSSHPQMFLHDPENDFFTSKIQFGQRFYGRSKELAKLLEITTVPNEKNAGLEMIFVSGMAGSGKSHLVSAVGDFVSNLGFMVLKAKFKRAMEYESREIVSTLMDDMLSNLVKMKDGDSESDIDYSCRVALAISDAFDPESLSALADFVPSIQSLLPEVITKENPKCTHWQLVFLLSKLLRAVLSRGRKTFIALDDLQWSDTTTLGLIREVLLSIVQYPEDRERLVFVGMYRDDEVSSDLLVQYTKSFVNLKWGGRPNVTEVNLSTLSLVDVSEIIMSELRLPRRLVSKLADVVHKRTQGHALFVVQLLNSLVSDSTISYSPMLRQFCWDQDKVRSLKTSDNVASFTASNLTLLPAEELQCLRILSCFGIQVQSELLELLEALPIAPKGGFKPYLRTLIDKGILDIVSTNATFTHDLIQEQVYKGIPLKEGLQLHFDIGTFLGSKTSLDVGSQNKSLDAAINQLYLSDASEDEGGFVDMSSLVSIATSQINKAGPDFFADRKQRTRFASWNLSAGKVEARHSNFGATLHYYQNGIIFLGDGVWTEASYDLCLKLHEGAAYASSALGEFDQIEMYTSDIIKNANFEDSLVAEYLLIGSLSTQGKYKGAVARGLAVLRQLKFDIPATPSPMAVMQMMEQTEREAFVYDFSQIADQQRRVDSRTRNTMMLVDAISAAGYQIASPFLPLVASVTVRHSLQNGICEESASAFVIFAYFQVFLMQSFESGRRWGDMAKNMLKKASTEGPATSRARFLLYLFLNFWYVPLQESINHMQKIEDTSLKCGETERAYMTQCMRFRFVFFRGEHLSILSREVGKSLQSMARFSIESAKYSALDKEMIDSLMGDASSNPYAIFEGKICDRESLLADSHSKMHSQIAEAVHLQKFFVSFWMGNYGEAVRASDVAMTFPSAKMPRVQLVYHIFYRGIVAFNLYRDGKGEKWLAEGNSMQDQMEIWVQNSKPIFENKLVLLEAEHYASMCNVVAAKESYELSIKVARDHGYIHEQGLAYECMGKYLKSIVEVQDAERCFIRAHDCYMQWGAVAKAKRLLDHWNLGPSAESNDMITVKHGR